MMTTEELSRHSEIIYKKLDKIRDLSIKTKSEIFNLSVGLIPINYQPADIRTHILLDLNYVSKHIDFLDKEINLYAKSPVTDHMHRRLELLNIRHNNNINNFMGL